MNNDTAQQLIRYMDSPEGMKKRCPICAEFKIMYGKMRGWWACGSTKDKVQRYCMECQSAFVAGGGSRYKSKVGVKARKS